MTAPSSSERSAKAALRAASLSRRDALSPEDRAAAAQILAGRVSELVPLLPPGCVSGFWPIRSEIDPRPAMERLAQAGFSLALPRVEPGGLVFCRWSPGEALAKAGFGLSEPLSAAEVVRPGTMLVPLAAFDRRGHRIGYGAGFYDRAIAAAHADGGHLLTVGVAFACQEVDQVPDEPHDRALDFLVTERETIRFNSR